MTRYLLATMQVLIAFCFASAAVGDRVSATAQGIGIVFTVTCVLTAACLLASKRQ